MSRFKKYKSELTASLESADPLLDELPPEVRMEHALNHVEDNVSSAVSVEGFFSNHGSRLIMKIAEGFDALTTWKFVPLERINPGQMHYVVMDLKYADFTDELVNQPIGMKGTMSEYIKALTKASECSFDIIKDVIDPATKRFGHYLSVPDERSDRGDYLHGADLNMDTQELYASTMTKVTIDNNTTATAMFGDVYHSLKDFVECENAILELIAKYGKNTPESVAKACQRMEQTASALIMRLSSGQDKAASSEFGEMVAKELKGVGKAVSYYAIVWTKLIEANNCIASTEKLLRK